MLQSGADETKLCLFRARRYGNEHWYGARVCGFDYTHASGDMRYVVKWDDGDASDRIRSLLHDTLGLVHHVEQGNDRTVISMVLIRRTLIIEFPAERLGKCGCPNQLGSTRKTPGGEGLERRLVRCGFCSGARYHHRLLTVIHQWTF